MFKFNNLTHKIGSKTLRQPVAGRARPGELLAVVGANGAGKSTLPRLLSGNLKPSSGVPLAQWPLAGLARRRAVLVQQHSLALAFQVRQAKCERPTWHESAVARTHSVHATASTTILIMPPKPSPRTGRPPGRQ